MGLIILLAAIVAACAAVPTLLERKLKVAGWYAAGTFIGSLIVFYLAPPQLALPLWGGVGVMVLAAWTVPVAVGFFITGDCRWHLVAPAALLFGIFCGRFVGGIGAFRHAEYVALAGHMEERTWTVDVQPADPMHIRAVPLELARYLADKQLGEAGAIGSQFAVDTTRMALQLVNNELWYVAALDYTSFSVWSSAACTPGYVRVHGEDPQRAAEIVTGACFRYMPGAYFDDNLRRHLWKNGYAQQGLTDYSFELDEAGTPWWVVTVYEPTIAWSGQRVLGVVIVNPTDGTDTFYRIGEVPDWVDRVVPEAFVQQYLTWNGSYRRGWVNSWWGKRDLTEPESSLITYGSDGTPWWVTAITSQHEGDEALVSIAYTNTRTGATRLYRANGGTEAAALDAVNNKVAYRHLHGDSPVLYNIYGRMAWIVPLLGASHTFQGIAIADADNLQVAAGSDALGALREYQALLAHSGGTITPELAHARATLRGTVERFAADVHGNTTTYYVYLTGMQKLFTGDSMLSPELPMTKIGDDVHVSFIASGETVVPLLAFDNHALELVGENTDDKAPAPLPPDHLE